MNPIHQWLEGKKKEIPAIWKIVKKGTQAEMAKRDRENYNSALTDLRADLPSLLSAMEAEIRGKIGGSSYDPIQGTVTSPDGDKPRPAEWMVKGGNEERHRIRTIIHSYFNDIRG